MWLKEGRGAYENIFDQIKNECEWPVIDMFIENNGLNKHLQSSLKRFIQYYQSIFSIIFDAIYGAVCHQLIQFSFDNHENISTS